jgi:hypothetical protein
MSNVSCRFENKTSRAAVFPAILQYRCWLAKQGVPRRCGPMPCRAEYAPGMVYRGDKTQRGVTEASVNFQQVAFRQQVKNYRFF